MPTRPVPVPPPPMALFTAQSIQSKSTACSSLQIASLAAAALSALSRTTMLSRAISIVRVVTALSNTFASSLSRSQPLRASASLPSAKTAPSPPSPSQNVTLLRCRMPAAQLSTRPTSSVDSPTVVIACSVRFSPFRSSSPRRRSASAEMLLVAAKVPSPPARAISSASGMPCAVSRSAAPGASSRWKMWKFRSPSGCMTTRVFSRRYVLMLTPRMAPPVLKGSSMNLPKREELSLQDVLALPKASSSGLLSSTRRV